MSDELAVTGIECFAHHGVFDFERREGQVFVVDLVLGLDVSAAATSDDLADTVDYGAICTAVEQAIVEGHVQLLEFLAGKLADAVLAVDRRIVAVEVAVRKLRPPVPQHLATSGVRITRLRS